MPKLGHTCAPGGSDFGRLVSLHFGRARWRRRQHAWLAIGFVCVGLSAGPAVAEPICSGESFPGAAPGTLVSSGNISFGSALNLPTVTLQPMIPLVPGQPHCLLAGKCVPEF